MTPSDGEMLDAGDFRTWMGEMEAAMRGRGESEVACGSCTACCTSSQFILVEPDETRALKRIPSVLLFPAPRMPKGYMLMGYDKRGHCPMLIDNRCSIYGDRPRTCRTYDCRIFPASGVANDDPGKDGIAERAIRWRFSYADPADLVFHEAIKAAAEFVRSHRDQLVPDAVPHTSTQLAVLAFQIHDAFVEEDESGSPRVTEPDIAVINQRFAP